MQIQWSDGFFSPGQPSLLAAPASAVPHLANIQRVWFGNCLAHIGLSSWLTFLLRLKHSHPLAKVQGDFSSTLQHINGHECIGEDNSKSSAKFNWHMSYLISSILGSLGGGFFSRMKKCQQLVNIQDCNAEIFMSMLLISDGQKYSNIELVLGNCPPS